MTPARQSDDSGREPPTDRSRLGVVPVGLRGRGVVDPTSPSEQRHDRDSEEARNRADHDRGDEQVDADDVGGDGVEREVRQQEGDDEPEVPASGPIAFGGESAGA